MKRILALVLITTLVGCASAPPMNPETAINICVNAGVKKGTPDFVNCMTNVLNSEAAKGKPSVATQYMLNRASNPGSRSRDVVCTPWLNGMKCEEW